MIQKIADIEVKKVCIGFVILCVSLMAAIATPSWAREVTLEEIGPLQFSAADEDKVKVAIFSSYKCDSRIVQFYENVFEILSSMDSQQYRIIVNPFKIKTFGKSELFAYDAGRKMKADVVVFIFIRDDDQIRPSWSFVEYTLYNILKQKALKDVLYFGNVGADHELSPVTIANQLFNEWKPFLSSVTAADKAAQEESLQSAALDIAANVAGATVTLNGEEKGVTPLTVDDIAPGQYIVQVSKEGYQAYEERVRVESGKTLRLDISLELIADTGTINVSGSPKGAKVYLDGFYCCALPCTIGSVATGKHTVMVKNSGYRDWDFTVDVPAGQKLQFEVVLKRISTQKAASQQKQVLGEVTSIQGDSIGLNLGVQGGIKVGDTGRVFFNVTIEGNERPIFVATFKVIEVTEKSCTAQIIEKTRDVQIGYLVEINP